MRREAIVVVSRVVLTAVLACGGGVASAVDTPVLGTKLVIKGSATDPTKRALSFKSADPAVSVAGIDPTVGGATLEVLNPNPGLLQSAVFQLPAAGWSAVGSPPTGYKYKDKPLANGPVKAALVKGGTLVKATAKGASMTFTLGSPQVSVGIIFASPSVRYCTLFGGAVKKDDGTKFVAGKATAPASCPSLTSTTTTTTVPTTTTTTTTVTTTTTTVPTTTTSTTTTTPTTTTTTTTGVPVCGNGVREGTEECDDGNEESTDACTNQCKNARCGDGITRFGVEACDDGNASNADCCSTTCQFTPPVCGNGCLSPGETCDDGNTVNGDACPSDCVINGCTPSGTQQQATITLKRTSPPSPSSLTAFNLFLEYPDGQVQILGSGSDANVVANTPFLLSPAGRSVSRNDVDYGVNLGVLGTSNMLPNTNPTAVFHVNFDLCTPATVPTPAQLPCTIRAATGTSGTDYTAAQLLGLTCTVTVP